MRQLLSMAALLSTVGLSSSFALADVQHTIGRGHTLTAIASRYHVSPQAILEANHLKDGRHLKVGDVLVIPKAETKGGAHESSSKDAKAKSAHGKKDEKPSTYAAKAKTPGIIHIHRLATTEGADVRVPNHGTKLAPATMKTMEKMLRSQSGASHPIEPRLVALLGVVSNHFGSRQIEVVSGFRPFTPTQYNPHSNHNHGKAVDFRVVGVPNEVVRDFCRTLKNVGCGYYPNSTFVHMDVRETSAFWIDYSKPGERPRYNAANVEADEGTSDVHNELSPETPSAPAETSAPASPASEPPAAGEGSAKGAPTPKEEG
jgi:uncharacterized protein YcbK (DUF882 family)